MKDGTQLPLKPSDLVIKGELHTQKLNRDLTLVRVELQQLIFLEMNRLAAGITLPAETEILIVVPASYGRWIDDRYFEQAEAAFKERAAQSVIPGVPLPADELLGRLLVSEQPDGETADIPF